MNEKTLFYPSTGVSVDIIWKYGFNLSICHKTSFGNFSLFISPKVLILNKYFLDEFGQGIYFYLNSSYNSYMDFQVNTVNQVFSCKVLISQFTVGNSSITATTLPKVNNKRVDSTVNTYLNPDLFVVYDETHVFPEYLINFE